MRGFRICLIGLAVFFTLASVAIAAESLTVQVREAAFHEEPTFLGRVVGTAPYGSPVTLVQRQGDWMFVEFGGMHGWVHATALTEQPLSLRSGGAVESVSSDELALAGKGFNPAVESSFRASHGGGYQWVDRAEAMRMSPEELAAFIEQGGLNTARCVR